MSLMLIFFTFDNDDMRSLKHHVAFFIIIPLLKIVFKAFKGSA